MGQLLKPEDTISELIKYVERKLDENDELDIYDVYVKWADAPWMIDAVDEIEVWVRSRVDGVHTMLDLELMMKDDNQEVLPIKKDQHSYA